MYSADLLLVTDFRVVDNVNMCCSLINVELYVLTSSKTGGDIDAQFITCALVSQVLLTEK